MSEDSHLLASEQQTPNYGYGSLASTRINPNIHGRGDDNYDHDPKSGNVSSYDSYDNYDDRETTTTITTSTTSSSTTLHLYNHGPASPSSSSLRARLQIPLLCYVRVMEPISYYSIFPYIAQMTTHNGNLPDSDIGFYTGVFESLFSAVQALVLIFWGSMADRVGYKRMLVCSLSGMAIAPVLFGLSTSLWQMAVFRCLNGAFAGSNIILRSMLMHRCTPKTQVRAFSWYTFADNFALFVGPMMGGALADPVAQYPAIFKGISFFESFPYVLPGLVGGAACASAAIIAIFFIDDANDVARREDSDAGLSSSRPSLHKLVRAPGVLTLLCMLMSVKVLVSSMMAVSNTALYTPVGKGGMGYTSRQIALLITAQGGAETVWLLLVFPSLHRRVGTKGILYWCAAMFVAVFASYTSMSATLRYGWQAGQAWHWVAWLGVVIFGSGTLMAGTSGQLALQNLAPNPRALGTLNAVAETCVSIVKTVTPAASTTIFAIGVRTQALEGYLIWAILIFISPMVLVTAKWLPSWTDSRHK